MPDVLCDSSSLISLTYAGMDDLLYKMHEQQKVRFLVPHSVVYESVDNPFKRDIKQYFYSAYRIKQAISDGVLVQVTPDQALLQATERVLKAANETFFVRGKPFNLVHRGEAEVLASARELGVNLMLMDERTLRILVEAPFRLKQHLEEEFHVSVFVNKTNMQKLSDIVNGVRIIRSSELAILGYENGYFKGFDQNIRKSVLEAALFKLKFSGCAVSFDEIRELMKSV